MNRFVCIHGHFYQPPRDNPWLDAIEPEASARPYHDWNERITAECYAPNAASRILDGEGWIAAVVNNYARISFNFGPTLLAWMQAAAPAVYAAVIAADRASRERFAGHGSALAQAYNHMILPLANRRDKQTQIVWGLGDFEQRFGRPAAGLWLPETAVDLASLDLMAANGVRFTVLEPHQARRVRALPPPAGGAGSAGGQSAAPTGTEVEGRAWRDVSGGRIDTTLPYRVRLPSGRSIAVFFYDGPIARGVAFERLLASGEGFAGRLLAAFDHCGAAGAAAGAAGAAGRLVHIASDGETYGHHHRHGEMALAYALQKIEESGYARLTNYGEFLAGQPPLDEVEIVENSSWSCVHGIDRWREDCGCRIGGGAGWNQAWRAPLRQALDELRDELAPLYEQAAGELFGDPWQARDDYIALVLDRSPEAMDAFFESHAAGATPDGDRRARGLALLEMQRHAMLMFTSCGWFFDDLAGIEPVQVMRYAGRAAQLADELCGSRCEGELRRRLAWARSNDPAAGNGRDLYDARVRPAAAAAAGEQTGALAGSLRQLEEELEAVVRRHAALPAQLDRAAHRDRAVRGAAVSFAVGSELRAAIADPAADTDQIDRCLQRAVQLGVALDAAGLAAALDRSISQLLDRAGDALDADAPELLGAAAGRAALACNAPFPVNLWEAQNLCCELRDTVYPTWRAAAQGDGNGGSGDAAAVAWVDQFRRLAASLTVRLD
jgi:alpha-amylase/alpha-mannosidase (GH57 family)